MRNKVLLIDITFDPSQFSLDSPFKIKKSLNFSQQRCKKVLIGGYNNLLFIFLHVTEQVFYDCGYMFYFSLPLPYIPITYRTLKVQLWEKRVLSGEILVSLPPATPKFPKPHTHTPISFLYQLIYLTQFYNLSTLYSQCH